MKKIISFLIIGLSFFVLTSIAFLDFFKVVPTSYALEFCSCKKIEKQSSQYCDNYSKQIIPITSFKEEEVLFTANFFHHKTQVQFVNNKIGCRIL